MIPKECKRLAEVDFPIAVVSKHSAREKSIRHGHPSTLHLWWARRPLAACRAMLMALLLPDPCDPHCPSDFKTQARELLNRPLSPASPGATDADLRTAILNFIGDFANWDHAAQPLYLEIGRGLVKAAHPEETPLVVDPFAGGGSIPLEALRLGCDAFASDLNPVACLINKVLLEDIPRHGPELADELRRVGSEIKKAAEEELAEFYPRDPDGARPIAYLWARTVRCEAPNCGAEIPLMRSFWLCKKADRRRALRPKIVPTQGSTAAPGCGPVAKGDPNTAAPASGYPGCATSDARSTAAPGCGPVAKGDAETAEGGCATFPRVEFEIFAPAGEKEVRGGTVSRARATCVCCGTALPPDRVRAQLAAQRGGADTVFDDRGRRAGGATLVAVVTLRDGQTGRHYRLPTDADYTAVWKAQQRLKEIVAAKSDGGLSPIPDEPTPAGGGSGAGRAFSVQKYGMLQWGDLFSRRQKLALHALGNAIAFPANERVQRLASLALSRCTEQMSSLVRWRITVEAVAGTFGRAALPIMWDYVEIVASGDQGSNYLAAVEWVAEVAGAGFSVTAAAHVQNADATNSPIPAESAAIWFTDPPYYDAIPYSDLSDYFLVWLKRTLPRDASLTTLLDRSTSLSPKLEEVVQDETKAVRGQPKDRNWFEGAMLNAFREGRQVLRDDGVGSVVFAHKTTEGWEALLSGLVRGGWTITASWPIATERPGRLRAQDSAALATSVHLVCRPRPEDAPIGDWAHVLRELPKRVGDWMERLQGEGVRGADLVFACIGPALEVYSRYGKVVDAEEREIPLGGDPESREPHQRGFLAYVWEVVGRAALEQVLGTAEAKARNGAAGALEEDARLTALFLWTVQATDVAQPPSAGAGTVAQPPSAGARLPKATATQPGAAVLHETKKPHPQADPRAVLQEEDEPNDDDDDDDDETPASKKKKGLTLPFDVARRFAQPLGIHLDDWAGRTIEIEKGVVRLVPVVERAEQLFGEEGAEVVADRLESHRGGPIQPMLFPVDEEAPPVPVKGRKRKGGRNVSDEALGMRRGATTLDHVHAAMLLQSAGRTNALRALLKAEIERGPDFLRLANALSALYPKDSDEKRLLDAMLLAVPR